MINETLTQHTTDKQANENSSWLLYAYSILSAPVVMLCSLASRLALPSQTFHQYQALPDDLKGSLGINAFLGAKDVAALTVSKAQHRLLKPELDALKLLWLVARGQQNEAHRLLTIYPEFQLLVKKGTVTDHAGRTFTNITAYEYAYWAKDTHMCRMLEQHMDDTTKTTMLAYCEVIDTVGLAYEQQGKKILHSKYFDFSPLKTALEHFIMGYDHWLEIEHLGINNFNRAWNEVGKAQRDAPAHVINEYCRQDRSFYPRPRFNEDILPRELPFKMKGTSGWLPSVFWDIRKRSLFSWSSADVSLFRGQESEAVGISQEMFGLYRDEPGDPWVSEINVRRQDVVIDLDAITHLDEVRTADRTQSRIRLNCANRAADSFIMSMMNKSP